MRTQRQKFSARSTDWFMCKGLFPYSDLKRTSKQAELQRTARCKGSSHSFTWQITSSVNIKTVMPTRCPWMSISSFMDQNFPFIHLSESQILKFWMCSTSFCGPYSGWWLKQKQKNKTEQNKTHFPFMYKL